MPLTLTDTIQLKKELKPAIKPFSVMECVHSVLTDTKPSVNRMKRARCGFTTPDLTATALRQRGISAAFRVETCPASDARFFLRGLICSSNRHAKPPRRETSRGKFGIRLGEIAYGLILTRQQDYLHRASRSSASITSFSLVAQSRSSMMSPFARLLANCAASKAVSQIQRTPIALGVSFHSYSPSTCRRWCLQIVQPNAITLAITANTQPARPTKPNTAGPMVAMTIDKRVSSIISSIEFPAHCARGRRNSATEITTEAKFALSAVDNARGCRALMAMFRTSVIYRDYRRWKPSELASDGVIAPL